MGFDEIPTKKELKKQYDSNIAKIKTLEKSCATDNAEVQKLSTLRKKLDKFMDKDISKAKAK